eukprot:scaffold294_cov131-Isochrysis_galbana.AAC.7
MRVSDPPPARCSAPCCRCSAASRSSRCAPATSSATDAPSGGPANPAPAGTPRPPTPAARADASSHTSHGPCHESTTTSAWPPRSRTRSPSAHAAAATSVRSAAVSLRGTTIVRRPDNGSGEAAPPVVPLRAAKASARLHSHAASSAASWAPGEESARMQWTALVACATIASRATDDLPVPSGPMMSIVWPRPMGVSTSTAAVPVCRLAWMGCRSACHGEAAISGSGARLEPPPAGAEPAGGDASGAPKQSTTAGAPAAEAASLAAGDIAATASMRATPSLASSGTGPV